MLSPPEVYPSAHQLNVIDDYHGTPVADPFRWLEDPATEASREWTQAQNQLTRSVLDQPVRSVILKRLQTLVDYERASAPVKRGNRYFFWQHHGLQNQPILYWQKRFSEEPRPLLNPNTLSKQGIVSIMNTEPSLDGKWLAYSQAQRGSDWQEIHIRNVETRQNSEEVLQHTKFAGIAWHPDHSGFYYNRYPDPGTVNEADQTYYNRVYWHSLGSDQSEDILVYERPDQKDFDFWPRISPDGAYLTLTVHLGTDRRNRFYYRPLADTDGTFVHLLDTADAHYRFLGNQGQRFYFYTDYQAPRGQVIAIDITRPEPEHWETIIPETEDKLDQVMIADHHFVCAYLHHAHHRLWIYELSGRAVQEISLPTLGTVSNLQGKMHDNELFFSFSSFLFPARVYLYAFKTRELSVLSENSPDFDPEAYTTRQVFCHSKDGTAVPMFLVYRKDLEPLQELPVMMYGYGGFRNALTPNFSATLIPWLEQGGIYCQVNTRGGSEYGTDWYRAGTLAQKQNVFDDFQAAARYLIAEGITRPDQLAIRGGSNGGLLVAACMLQAPELFGAVVCQVPVLDMLRYHRFTIGRYWASDYGNAETDPEHFAFLKAYSPLHNVKSQQVYPPVLITSADHDDRVVPAHAKKFAATVQSLSPESVTLLRVDTDAGHGAGKPLSKSLEEFADIYTFLIQALQLNWR
ncbi:MAG: S9 family peptidase [Candidatus Sericytochromatia bacterium]|nr:S9 family peptidase [Candidatus Sericytochromatia bacterium]